MNGVIRGYDPDGIYVFEVERMLTANQCKAIKEGFAKEGLKNVIVVCGGKLKPSDQVNLPPTEMRYQFTPKTFKPNDVSFRFGVAFLIGSIMGVCMGMIIGKFILS